MTGGLGSLFSGHGHQLARALIIGSWPSALCVREDLLLHCLGKKAPVTEALDCWRGEEPLRHAVIGLRERGPWTFDQARSWRLEEQRPTSLRPEQLLLGPWTFFVYRALNCRQTWPVWTGILRSLSLMVS